MKVKIYVGFLMCLMAVTAAQSAMLAQYEWDSVDWNPTSQGWTYVGPTGYVTNNATDGAVKLIQDVTPNLGGEWSYILPEGSDQDSTGWTYTVKMRCAFDWNAAYDVSMILDESDGGRLQNFTFYNNPDQSVYAPGVYARYASSSSVYDTFVTEVSDIGTVFHTYQMVKDPSAGGVIGLYIDGVKIAGAVAGDASAQSLSGSVQLRIGSGNGWVMSNSEWQSISFETGVNIVPEPATMALLSLGGLLVVRRKKK